MSERLLVVWWDDPPVGRLMQDRYGDLPFDCDTGWLARTGTRVVPLATVTDRGLRPAHGPSVLRWTAARNGITGRNSGCLRCVSG